MLFMYVQHLCIYDNKVSFDRDGPLEISDYTVLNIQLTLLNKSGLACASLCFGDIHGKLLYQLSSLSKAP